MFTRRTMLLAMPQVVADSGLDPWQQLAQAWNPFAEAMNKGVVDLAKWKKVVRAVERIQGASCR